MFLIFFILQNSKQNFTTSTQHLLLDCRNAPSVLGFSGFPFHAKENEMKTGKLKLQ